MAAYEADLEAVVDRLKLDRFTLLGRAYKGHAAVTYTVKHPTRVRALVLWNCRVDGAQGTSAAFSNLHDNNWESWIDVSARTLFESEEPLGTKKLLFSYETYPP